MIDEKKYSQYGAYGLLPKAITIHNTNNYDWSAQDLFNYINSECKTSQGVHLIADHNGIIEVMPLDWKVWHTGKGNDWAFNNSIAIEICSNLDNELYLKGQQIAIDKIKELMKTYNLTNEDLYFHNDFNQTTYCPANILDLYKSKKVFLEKFFGKE